MHKITKGLKKKKKGKKSKHKEDELFKPEELEAYRREHQATEEPGGQPGQNEEWKKFIALTSGVDDILKKTQGDLDRIKSTSFFKRIPPPSEVKKREEAEAAVNSLAEERCESAQKQEPESSTVGIVQISESESEEEDEDDIFDTAYIDAIAAGEVKLAYIPESPTEEAGEDPFDTSIAERAILGPAVERKGKKLVPIGAAVEVLTGRVQLPTCAVARPASSRRQILKERDLLLGSFDDNANSISTENKASDASEEVTRTLLDDDAPISDEPIDLSRSLHLQAQVTATPGTEQSETDKCKDVISEFDVISKVEDEDDAEFAALAAESLTKTPIKTALPPTVAPVNIPQNENWAAFSELERHSNGPVEDNEIDGVEVDPFDTTFAENILPGKAELKQIEDEILNEDIDFDPRAEDKLSQIINKVRIKVTDPAGQRESISSLDRVSESELHLITPFKRDLLGGSNTDLSNLGDQPLKPSEQFDNNYIEYCDPFDTSIVETAKLPGHTELKFLEKELLGDLQGEEQNALLSDEEFDPRSDERKGRTLSRPDVLHITTKTVSFDLPTPPTDLLAAEDCVSKVCKPLTPFYVRKNSVPGQHVEEDNLNEDPFDTSFVCDIGPGKTELRLIESELFDPVVARNLSISDQDFDPRDDQKTTINEVVESIKDISNNKKKVKEQPIDLLAVDHDVDAKVLTPSANKNTDEISYTDPFDTSIASNILPGKTELRLLETEIIHSSQSLEDADFDPRAFVGGENKKPRAKVDLLDHSEDIVIRKPLKPLVGEQSFDNNPSEDPFDTSIASNIAPGKAELKLIESELI